MSNQANVDVDATAENVAFLQYLLGVAEEPPESPEAAETEVSEQPQRD